MNSQKFTKLNSKNLMIKFIIFIVLVTSLFKMLVLLLALLATQKPTPKPAPNRLAPQDLRPSTEPTNGTCQTNTVCCEIPDAVDGQTARR